MCFLKGDSKEELQTGAPPQFGSRAPATRPELVGDRAVEAKREGGDEWRQAHAPYMHRSFETRVVGERASRGKGFAAAWVRVRAAFGDG